MSYSNKLKEYVFTTLEYNSSEKGPMAKVYFGEYKNEVFKKVCDGIYAFQFIYTNRNDDMYVVKLVKDLDYRKLRVVKNEHQSLWAYNRGNYDTYYGTGEILMFDVSVIRDLKLKENFDI